MITLTNKRLFARAYELALHGEHRVRVGALAAVKSTPVAGAFNTFRNNPNNVVFTAQTRHAEWNCMHMVPYTQRTKVSLYVARVDTDNNLKASMPCVRCRAMLKRMNVKEVIFWDQTIQKISIQNL